MENSETQGWLEFALACDYLTEDAYAKFKHLSEDIGRLVQYMIDNPGKFGA